MRTIVLWGTCGAPCLWKPLHLSRFVPFAFFWWHTLLANHPISQEELVVDLGSWGPSCKTEYAPQKIGFSGPGFGVGWVCWDLSFIRGSHSFGFENLGQNSFSQKQK